MTDESWYGRPRRSSSQARNVGALFRRAGIALLGVSVVTVSRALGQQTSGMQPLAIPNSDRILCRVMPSDTAARSRRVAHEFEFSIGRVEDENRDIRVSFDSSGAPIQLFEIATLFAAGGRPVLHTIVVQFKGSAPMGFHWQGDGTAATRPRPGQPLPPLTDSQEQQVRALAKWLWERRCGRVGKFSPSP